MAGRVIDLTFDDSSDENTVSNTSKPNVSKSTSTRQPLNPIPNNVQLPPIASLLPASQLSAPLIEALNKASAKRVLGLLMMVCRNNSAAKALVEREFLVPKREVVAYHANTDSEDGDEESEEESESESGSENESVEANAQHQVPAATSLKRRAEAIVDNELFSRFAQCENCYEEFDVTSNERGDCVWHEGEKEVCNDDDFWADHDDDCHGDPYSDDLMNDSTYEDGYKWTCCDRLGGEDGCKQTKHKTAGQPRKKSRHAVPPTSFIESRASFPSNPQIIAKRSHPTNDPVLAEIDTNGDLTRDLASYWLVSGSCVVGYHVDPELEARGSVSGGPVAV
ncbi:hypothetical protein LAWI1_G003830 [Lachnellula willkommii]|uniref:Uncharacterized protein n=1 Tax=Lachnellula willkommii TaxID=215461 RepID=A0A559MCB6_9HELO|nr:hypothetical protein LAWI1_G003830 [Lachnellula willkommii]